ncbi:hypothetical protein MIMGU_mgv1a021365mg, partial [Erythranthe guttata]
YIDLRRENYEEDRSMARDTARFDALVKVARQRLQELIEAKKHARSKSSTSTWSPPQRPRTKRIIIEDKPAVLIETADDDWKVDQDEEEQEEDEEYSDNKSKRRKLSDNIPKKKKEPIGNGPHTPPPLPEEYKMVIQEIGRGRNITEEMKLVIQKGLFETDLAKANNRLSIPFTQVLDHSFLTDEETHFLTTRDGNNKMKFKEVTIIEPSLERDKVKLSRWDMNKANGKNTSSNYVINGAWRHVAERNNLKPGNVVQLWSFRIDHELYLALVKIPNNSNN